MLRNPRGPTGTGKQAYFLRRTSQVVNQNKPFGGPGVTVNQTTRGTYIHAKRKRGRRGGGGGTDDLVWL